MRSLRIYSGMMICLILSIVSCNPEKENNSFRLLSSEDTGLKFSNELGVSIDLNILNYMYYYNGGGLAVADLNNDGLSDVILSSNRDKEKVFLNEGNLRFIDVSDVTRIDGGPNSWTNGVAVADVNGDGLLDVYLAQVGDYRELDCHNNLFICTGINNDGIPVYKEMSKDYGLDFKGFSTQAGFFDYDLDGDLDMFLMNHSLHHNGTFGKRELFLNTYDSISGDRLYRNDGNTFTDVTLESGINSSVIGYGLGLAFSDVNLDGWPDIYVGNDFHENDYLYINQKDGTFKDELTSTMMHTSRFSMGVDVADVNGDVFPDIMSLDMLPENPDLLKSSEGEDALDIFKFKLRYGYNHQYAKNALQVNNGNGVYSEVAMMAGVHATDWSWSPLIFDMNMDGHNDIFVSNGIPKRMNDIDYIDFISNSDVQYKIQFDQLKDEDLAVIDRIPEIKLKNKFYLNKSSLDFEDIGSSIGNNQISYSNSAAYADLDGDGDYDIICNNINDEAFLYENLSDQKGTVVSIEGPKGNVFGIGSKLFVYKGGNVRMFENFSTRGFQATAINKFLVPAITELDSLVLVWPDNTYQKLAVKDSSIQVKYREGLASFNYGKLIPQSEFSIEEISNKYNLNYTHDENPFVEFNRESLIPHASSNEGPALCVDDFNGDGLDDVFVGSAKRKWNALFIQDNKGQFRNTGHIGVDSIYEEVEAISADFNGNGIPDLVLATGGNEFAYTNDNTAQLIVFDPATQNSSVQLLPLNMTASCVDAADFDNDGDLDLFFGARAMVSNYGADVLSSILVNEGNGTFDLFPDDYIPQLSSIGMVKDAEWIDFDGDGDQDLMIAEEWGGIKLFTNEGGRFEVIELIDHKAWWNCISVEDLDNDGDLDIFAGNLGLNSRLKASPEQPVRMYYNDFDDNGSREQIVTYYLMGREVPFSNFKEIKAQIPKIKKEFLYASDFAKADVRELFGMEKVNSSKVYEMNFMEHAVFENMGNGEFETHVLPRDIQISSINTVQFEDFNGDGLKDMFTAGNFYDCNIQMGRYDADYGRILINQGNCKFEAAAVTGHNIKGQVRASDNVKMADGSEAIVIAKNDDKMELLSIKKQ